MMSPQLLLLTALATVSWINAVERCVDCNLLPTKEASDVPRPASCSTDCFLRDQTKPEIFTPWSKLGPLLQFDDAGIYYEPAEMSRFDQVSFIPQPFYILNPAYQVDRRISRSATKIDEVIESPNVSLNKHVLKSKHNKQDKHKKKDENGHKKSEGQLKKLPFYLDVDVQEREPRTQSRDASVADIHFENLKLTEQYLSICLDLHVLEFYRKNDSTFKNLKDIWDDPKFHYYESLSDLDLEEEIIKKCNHSIDMVKKSLDEIKETWPKNNNMLSFTSAQTFPVNARSGNISNKTFHIQPDDVNSKASSPITISTPINLSFTEQTTSTINIINSTASKNTLISHNVVKDSEYGKTGNEFHIRLISPVNLINLDTTTASTVGRDTLVNTSNITRVTLHHKVKESSLPNFYVEDSLHLNSSYGPGHKHIEGKADLSSYTNSSFTNSKIYFIPMMQKNINIIPKNVKDMTTPAITEPIMTESETVPGYRNNERSFITTSYAENGNMDSKVKIQVSDIVTKEYPNDTAISSVEGLKYSFSNNTIFTLKDTSAVSITSDTQTPMTTANTVETTDNKKKMKSENLSSEDHLSGNLYFLYRNHSIPARFIQHPDGKINIGLDSYSMCDSVDDSTMKSVLLNVLCNCVKFNNCTNS